MSRRRVVKKREIMPDPKFGSVQLTKFINVIMRDGKKAVAEKVVYNALELAAERVDKKPPPVLEQDGAEAVEKFNARALELYEKAIQNIAPAVEVRSRRVGGATYQIPVEIKSDRSMALAMRWLKKAAQSRGEKGMYACLANEIMDATENRGNAVEKRKNTHSMAEANKAFAHFAW